MRVLRGQIGYIAIDELTVRVTAYLLEDKNLTRRRRVVTVEHVWSYLAGYSAVSVEHCDEDVYSTPAPFCPLGLEFLPVSAVVLAEPQYGACVTHDIGAQLGDHFVDVVASE